MKNRLSYISCGNTLKSIFVVLCLCCCNICTSAQEIDSVDSVQNKSVIVEQKLTIAPPPSSFKQPQTYWHPNPNRAMWYSVLCPGLGQIYNRSYWKVPLIYGGGAVFGYLISWQGRMYNDYSNAYYDYCDNDPNTKSYETMFKNITNVNDSQWIPNTLKKKRDSYRRYRDLCIFGVGILYVLNIVDAFVDGHLYDFSVTNDLSFRIEPVIQPQGIGGYTDENRFGFQCNITF